MTVAVMTTLAVLFAAGICLGTGAFRCLSWLWQFPLWFAGIFLGLALVIFLVLWLSALAVDPDKPRKKDSPYYRFLCGVGCDLARYVLGMKLETRGLELVPAEGRFLLVCNHINDLDPAVILNCLPQSQLAFISKRENSRLFIVGKLMHMILCQLINRENDREALKTILNCIQLLRDDKVSIGVFPEGYTSLDGKLRPFRNGVFKIAQRAGVPVVVCTVKGTRDVMGNLKHLRSTPVAFHVLGVLDVTGMNTARIGEQVYAMMAEDLGADLVFHDTKEEEQ